MAEGAREIRLLPVSGIGEIHPGDNLGKLIVQHCSNIADGDILVISSKCVSKAEGRVFREENILPSSFAMHISEVTGNSPSYCELVLRESAEILRLRKGVVICRTQHGFVIANAGVDASNAGGNGLLVALPLDPDASANAVARSIEHHSGSRVGVVVSDTFGRAWREGQINPAIGISGVAALRCYENQLDNDGRLLSKTRIAVADELAAAAELAAGKTAQVAAVLVRGYLGDGNGSINNLILPIQKDLFP